MGYAELGEMEQKFALIIWEKQPVSSGELVKICEKEFGWKKSTTYTMLKRLCQRGIFENQQGTVIAILSQEDFLQHKEHTSLKKTLEEVCHGFW